MQRRPAPAQSAGMVPGRLPNPRVNSEPARHVGPRAHSSVRIERLTTDQKARGSNPLGRATSALCGRTPRRQRRNSKGSDAAARARRRRTRTVPATAAAISTMTPMPTSSAFDGPEPPELPAAMGAVFETELALGTGLKVSAVGVSVGSGVSVGVGDGVGAGVAVGGRATLNCCPWDTCPLLLFFTMVLPRLDGSFSEALGK